MSGERDGNGIEFKYRAVDAEAAPHPPPQPRSYFTEQAIRAGYMAPGIGRIYENIQNPLLIRGLFQIELEKERIRNEIIASEIAWRRVVEAEVRTEMMLERELALQDRGCNVFDRFSFFPVAGMRSGARDLSFDQIEGRSLEERIAMSLVKRFGNGSGARDLSLEQIERRSLEERIAMSLEKRFGNGLGSRDLSLEQIEGRSLEERIAMSLEKRFGNGSGHEIEDHQAAYLEERRAELKTGAGHQIISFQQRAVEPKFEVATLTSQTKPEQNTFLAKRKSLTPPRQGTTELLLIDVPKKRVKREWSCGICNVNATSEHGLSDHFNGKKHKAKEAALAGKGNGIKFGIGIHHKKTAKVSILGATSNTSSTEQGEKSMVQLLETKGAGDASVPKVNEVLPVVVIPKNEQEASAQLANKKKKCKFWCEMCQVGTFSESVMEEHRIGKKHVKQLEEATKNATVPIPLTDRTEAKNAKNLTKM